eukprot:evm.model.scf_1775.1 EVM.evm.TU.scf_1775.1   scf_1775:4739-13346(-)
MGNFDVLPTESGIFFKTVGAIRVESSKEPKYTAASRVLACASHHGLVFYGHGSGVLWTSIKQLVEASSDDASNGTSGVFQSLHYEDQEAISVCISPDESLLAVSLGRGAVAFHSIHSIAVKGQTNAMRTVPLPSRATYVAWGPGKEDHIMALTEDGTVLKAGLDGSMDRVGENIAVMAPSTTCNMWASASNDVPASLKLHGPGGTFEVALTHSEVDCSLQLAIKSLHWASECKVLVGCAMILEDGSELPEAPVLLVQWIQWDSSLNDGPTNLQVYELGMFAYLMTPPDRQGRPGPCLHFSTVEEWNLAIFAHAKALDFHVSTAECGGKEEGPKFLEPVENGALVLPMASDDTDNYVVGMAVDLTSVQVDVSWDNKDLPPSPLLLIGSSDGCIRLYSIGKIGTTTSPVSEPKVAQEMSGARAAKAARGPSRLNSEGEVSRPSSTGQTPKGGSELAGALRGWRSTSGPDSFAESNAVHLTQLPESVPGGAPTKPQIQPFANSLSETPALMASNSFHHRSPSVGTLKLEEAGTLKQMQALPFVQTISASTRSYSGPDHHQTFGTSAHNVASPMRGHFVGPSHLGVKEVPYSMRSRDSGAAFERSGSNTAGPGHPAAPTSEFEANEALSDESDRSESELEVDADLVRMYEEVHLQHQEQMQTFHDMVDWLKSLRIRAEAVSVHVAEVRDQYERGSANPTLRANADTALEAHRKLELGLKQMETLLSMQDTKQMAGGLGTHKTPYGVLSSTVQNFRVMAEDLQQRLARLQVVASEHAESCGKANENRAVTSDDDEGEYCTKSFWSGVAGEQRRKRLLAIIQRTNGGAPRYTYAPGLAPDASEDVPDPLHPPEAAGTADFKAMQASAGEAQPAHAASNTPGSPPSFRNKRYYDILQSGHDLRSGSAPDKREWPSVDLLPPWVPKGADQASDESGTAGLGPTPSSQPPWVPTKTDTAGDSQGDSFAVLHNNSAALVGDNQIAPSRHASKAGMDGSKTDGFGSPLGSKNTAVLPAALSTSMQAPFQPTLNQPRKALQPGPLDKSAMLPTPSAPQVQTTGAPPSFQLAGSDVTKLSTLSIGLTSSNDSTSQSGPTAVAAQLASFAALGLGSSAPGGASTSLGSMGSTISASLAVKPADSLPALNSAFATNAFVMSTTAPPATSMSSSAFSSFGSQPGIAFSPLQASPQQVASGGAASTFGQPSGLGTWGSGMPSFASPSVVGAGGVAPQLGSLASGGPIFGSQTGTSFGGSTQGGGFAALAAGGASTFGTVASGGGTGFGLTGVGGSALGASASQPAIGFGGAASGSGGPSSPGFAALGSQSSTQAFGGSGLGAFASQGSLFGALANASSAASSGGFGAFGSQTGAFGNFGSQSGFGQMGQLSGGTSSTSSSKMWEMRR